MTVVFVICVNYIFLTGHERVGHKSLIIPLNMTDHWVVVESEHHKFDNHRGKTISIYLASYIISFPVRFNHFLHDTAVNLSVTNYYS
jgi:hypothetical protein